MRRVMLCLLCLVLLSGCLGDSDIRRRALVQLMGIDCEDDGFKLTLRVFNPSGQNEGGGLSGENQVIRAEGATLSEAIGNASLRVGRTAFLGDSRAIVIGRDASSDRMDSILNFLSENDEVYPQVVILVTEGKAGDIVDPEVGEDQTVVSHALEHITNSSVSRQSVCPSTLLSIAKDFYADGAGTAVLQVARRDEGTLVLFEPSGVVVFSGARPVGLLNDNQHRGMLYLRGMGEGILFNVNDPLLGRTALEVNKVSTAIKPRIEDGRPVFAIKLTAELLLGEATGSPAAGMGEDDLWRITRAASRAIKADMEDSLTAGAGLGGDVFGLWRYLRRDTPAYWWQNGKNWPALMQKMEADITVELRLKRLGN